jgi:hypothetical protein
MNAEMPIPNLTALVSNCWAKAEAETRQAIKERHHAAEEEFVTELFHGYLRERIQDLNARQMVRAALLKDLVAAFSSLTMRDKNTISSGVIATVMRHTRHVEGKTGGDLGLVLVRPDFQKKSLGVLARSERQHGLLCQAKMKRWAPNGKSAIWGEFTKNQQEILPQRLNYLALLLYAYDDAERTSLQPFTWQACQGVKLDDVRGWLRSGDFPSPRNSVEMLSLLARDKIGTSNNTLIDEVIAPTAGNAFIIRIGWPPGGEQPHSFQLLRAWSESQTDVVQVRQR